MLRDSEMEFDEIVSNTGKSKSTVSVHLKGLREMGIVSYKIHPNDNRKKIFYIDSKYLGSVNVSDQKELEETQKEYLVNNIVNDDGDFTVLLFHTFDTHYKAIPICFGDIFVVIFFCLPKAFREFLNIII